MEITLIIAVLFIIAAAYHLGYHNGMMNAARIVEEFAKSRLEPQAATKIPMIVGEQTEHDYIFRTHDGSFVCQSKSLTQAAIDSLTNLKINAVAVAINTEKYWFINGQVFDFDDEQVKTQLASLINGNKNT